MTYPKISLDIPKLNKTDGISLDNSNCDLSQDITRQVRISQLILACSFSLPFVYLHWKNDRLV